MYRQGKGSYLVKLQISIPDTKSWRSKFPLFESDGKPEGVGKMAGMVFSVMGHMVLHKEFQL